MNSLYELRQEADEAVQKIWFIQLLEEIERTDITLFLRLTIQHSLFVQMFPSKTIPVAR